MRSRFSLLGCLLTSLGLAGQSEQLPLPSRTLSINVAGFLQMGPGVQGELRIGKTPLYFAPYIRYQYPGLIYQLYFSEQFNKKTSPNTLGGGLQLKIYKSIAVGAWYWGVGCDYSYGQTHTSDWIRQYQYVWPMATIGVRWRSDRTGKLTSMGVHLGPYLTLKDQSWYTSFPSDKDNDKNNFFMAQFEVSIGLEKR